MIPTRPLGKTGHSVTLFALGGEGVLRPDEVEENAEVARQFQSFSKCWISEVFVQISSLMVSPGASGQRSA